MAFPEAAALSEFLTPIVEAEGLDLEGVKVVKAGKKSQVAVVVDADHRPDLDQLERVSQQCSQRLDEAEEQGTFQFGAGYTLEVSTPGVDSPLTSARHWRRNRGRRVEITTDAGAQQWRIGALNATESAVALGRREGKAFLVETLELAAPYQAVVQIEFAQPPQQEVEFVEQTFDQAVARREEHK